MASQFREPNQVKWVGCRPAHDGTQVSVAASKNNGTEIIYTVPASKVLFLCSTTIMCIPMAAGSGYILLRDAADAVVRYLSSVSAITAVGAHLASHLAFWPPLEIPAGYDLCVYSGAAGITSYGAIHGWVDDA